MSEHKFNFSILQPLIIIPFLWLLAGFLLINHKVNDLKHEKYEASAIDMSNKLQTLIDEKREAIMLISQSVAQDHTIKEALLNNSIDNLNLTKLSQEISNNTSLKDIWFQLLDHDGKSFYRSWTKKRGDDLIDVRLDIAKIINKPQTISSISTGKFDITFKSMVPIYDESGNFIGVVETMSKFNSIVKKMRENNYDVIILVDKQYKKQLTHPFTKTFISDYYVANLNANKKHLEIIKEHSVNHFIDKTTFHLNKKDNELIYTYRLPDIHGEQMAYFILFNEIKNVDFNYINKVKDSLMLFVVSVFIFLIALSYYIYSKKYKEFMQKTNIRLEEKVLTKTKELKQQSDKLEHLANHDFLTKLPNRMLLIDRLKQSIKHAKRNKENISVLFLDLDRFKEVNDTYGHETGDSLLVDIANKLRKCVREEDTIARLGGDEFTIIINSTNETATVNIVQKIMRTIKDSIIINNIELHTTFSIGISCFPQDGDSPEILLRNADTAMYEAKNSGKNIYKFYNSAMTEMAFERVQLESDLRKAIANNEFETYYQPKINAKTNKVIGLEALIRWNHPESGLIPPINFIPFAEEIGLIVQIDKWMIEQAMSQVLKWKNEDIQTGKISVNMSAIQLEGKNCTNHLKMIINKIGFDAKDLEVEITESQIMKNTQNSISKLKEMKDMGISISVDDFGTGYSSLSYLKHLPINKLKIDHSFVKGLPDDVDDIAIVRTIISLAKNLSLDLIAEGVETKEQKDFLLKEGCHNIQGYYYSKPIPANECREFLLKHM